MKWWQDPLNWILGLLIGLIAATGILEALILHQQVRYCQEHSGVFNTKNCFCVKDGKIIA